MKKHHFFTIGLSLFMVLSLNLRAQDDPWHPIPPSEPVVSPVPELPVKFSLVTPDDRDQWHNPPKLDLSYFSTMDDCQLAAQLLSDDDIAKSECVATQGSIIRSDLSAPTKRQKR